MPLPISSSCEPQSALPSVGAASVGTTCGAASSTGAANRSGGLDSCCSMTSAMLVACLVFVLACGVHAFAVRSGVAADTAGFAVSGLFFLLITAASHVVLSRESTAGPLVSLMISMAIRLLGTFLVLGGLLALSPLSRPEAVFNVLFWYITLTATDLLSVVRQKSRAVGGNRLSGSSISIVDQR